MAVIDVLCRKLNISSPTEAETLLLQDFLDDAKAAILRKAYPFDPQITELPSYYETIQVDIAVYLYEKQGTGGELSRTENGVSVKYESGGIPLSLLRGVIPQAGIPQ